MKFKPKPFKQEYPGFESVFDLERDVSEWMEDNEIMSTEFSGTVKVSITYEEDEDNE